jgi:phosphoribosylformylglycinamidine synthase I
MAKPRVLILRAPGTNCDEETAFAFQCAGAEAELLHVNRLLANPSATRQFQILCIPGGFSYGDDIAAGRIFGNQFRHHFAASLHEFKTAGKLILGICNGFQVLMKSGILLGDGTPDPPATLTWNDSGKFEDRWVHLATDTAQCIFLRDIDSLYLPVAHAEGKFVVGNDASRQKLATAGQLALRYTGLAGGVNGEVGYPQNPNGSMGNVAGVCDESGQIFGLMPHPERYIDRTHHPRWTRGEGADRGDGLAIFENAVRYYE